MSFPLVGNPSYSKGRFRTGRNDKKRIAQLRYNIKMNLYNMKINIFKFAVMTLICSFILLCPMEGMSVNFSVNPVRIFFNSENKTNVLTITNESNENVTLQIKAVTWTHDEDGKGIYSPTEDIIFFPKIVTIKADEKKIIRLGVRVPGEKQEKTYRLFLEEIPAPSTTENTAVKIIMNVGVPIFLSPVKTEAKGVIEKIDISKGDLNFVVRNDGNVHLILQSVRVTGVGASGGEVYGTEIAGGYLHHGKSRGFTIKIPEENCLNIINIDIEIKTDRLSIEEKREIAKEKCK